MLDNLMSSVNDGGFAVSVPSEMTAEQRRKTQKQLRKSRRATHRAEQAQMQVNGANSVGLPGFKSGGPNDPVVGGDGWMGEPASVDTPDATSRRNTGADAGPGDTDNDNVIDNRKRFYRTQRRAVSQTFDADAHRRNPGGDFTPDKEYPVASDGDPLPGEADMNKPSGEPQQNADQRDAAQQTVGENVGPKPQSRGSLARARSAAMQNPMLVAGGLALVALVVVVL